MLVSWHHVEVRVNAWKSPSSTWLLGIPAAFAFSLPPSMSEKWSYLVFSGPECSCSSSESHRLERDGSLCSVDVRRCSVLLPPGAPWVESVKQTALPAQLLYSSLRARQQFRHSEVLTCPHPTASGNLLPDASAPRQSLYCPPECLLPKSLPTSLPRTLQCLPIPFRKCRCATQPQAGSQDKLLITHHTMGTWSLSWRKLGRTCKNQNWETSRKPDDQGQQS